MNMVIFIITFVLFLRFAGQVHAIIIAPALILIPIAKLLALVVAALGIPVVSVGAIIGKISRNKKNIIFYPLAAILILILIAAVILRMTHPNNPWF